MNSNNLQDVVGNIMNELLNPVNINSLGNVNPPVLAQLQNPSALLQQMLSGQPLNINVNGGNVAIGYDALHEMSGSTVNDGGYKYGKSELLNKTFRYSAGKFRLKSHQSLFAVFFNFWIN